MDPVLPALRDRMEVIELPGYTEEDKLEIAKRFLLPRQREANGIDQIDFELPEQTLRSIIGSYTREAGVRNLEREIGSVCRKIARRVAEDEVSGPVCIQPKDLAELLGPVRFEPELAERAGGSSRSWRSGPEGPASPWASPTLPPGATSSSSSPVRCPGEVSSS
jgi:ATP-dependent Lon protease